MSLGGVLIVTLILLLVIVLPGWRHSRGWGYRPAGHLGVVLALVLVLFMAGRL
ncbi:DUF3309 family protein [Pseudomarimonas salicorniae]|uniref:DUF3309 family protein n=1 Tax=Pseudomarimonas salicorniae TaxID=2933270 RepID=A0ABT0GET8_9GAMM|nr:DUF3309 family protein [Lysobacter sp. CAU 1642]MCK7593063.1 DUF3309 family protein [Lysobacter sp. CAU 1642]